MTRKAECGTRETNERNDKSFVRSAVFACFVFSLALAAVSLGYDRTSAARRQSNPAKKQPNIIINMKIAFLILSILLTAAKVTGQMISSAVEVVTTYSQNEKFYLKSIPFDNEAPSLRGRTYVYEKGNATPLYVVERGFALVGEGNDKLILSNNGEVIFYAISWGANDS